MAPATVELDTLDSSRHSQDTDNTESHPHTALDESTLPPVDSGKAAWLFLAACWAVEAFVFGFGFSFGVFQDFYTTHEPFAGSGDIAVIGTTTLGTLYMGTPFVLMLCRLLPRWARWFTLLGLFTSTLSMAMSSFCTTVPQLIGTQGLMFGIGGCFAYCPCVVYIDEWFAKRKGMAYGVMWSAAGTGGVVLPLVLQVLLNTLGFETATRIWAGIFFAATLPLSFFIKPRLPHSATTHISPFNVRHLMSKLFALHQLFNFVQATGYFLPGIYLPTYARRIFGASDFLSTLTIMLVNISATIGCVIMGWMTDKLKVTTCIAISALGTTVTVLVIWGLATSLPVLYVFCVFYGLFAGSWTSVYPGIMRDVAKKGESAGHSSADPVVVMGYLLLARGIGNIVSGPLSEALIEGEPWRRQASAGYGSGYGALLVYSGVTALFSGTSFVLDYLGWL